MASMPTSGSLGDRMKSQYEDRYRLKLPRRTYTIIRIDGKAFHTWTRGLARPFSPEFMGCMDATTIDLCSAISGTVCAFTQSDEISLLLTDFATHQTEAWFDGNIQKMTSVAAATASAYFNRHWADMGIVKPPAIFDARVFVIPDQFEVANYFVWRQQDATRNAISMAAQGEFSQKELHGKGSSEMQEMLWALRGINFNDYPIDFKRGRLFTKVKVRARITRKEGGVWTEDEIERNEWAKFHMLPIFTQSPEVLQKIIPTIS